MLWARLSSFPHRDSYIAKTAVFFPEYHRLRETGRVRDGSYWLSPRQELPAGRPPLKAVPDCFPALRSTTACALRCGWRGAIGDAGEHITQPSFGVNEVEPGGLDERADRGCPLAAFVGAGEEVFLPTPVRAAVEPVALRSGSVEVGGCRRADTLPAPIVACIYPEPAGLRLAASRVPARARAHRRCGSCRPRRRERGCGRPAAGAAS